MHCASNTITHSLVYVCCVSVVGQPSLGSVVTSIMSQFTSARVQADMAVADVANLYLRDPLLKSFTVPRLKINNAAVNLQVCQCARASESFELRPLRVVDFLPQLAIATVRSGSEALQALSNAIQPVIKQTLPQFRAQNVSTTLSNLNADRLAVDTATRVLNTPLISVDNTTLLLSLLQQAALTQFSNATTSQRVYVNSAQVLHACLADVCVRLLDRELSKYAESIRTVVDAVRGDMLHELGVLVTKADLTDVDPLKVSTVALTFSEEAYTWETSSDGDKLVTG